jgi:hypothetical protein
MVSKATMAKCIAERDDIFAGAKVLGRNSKLYDFKSTPEDDDILED